MRGLKHFSIQLKSLKNGTHYSEYQVDKEFFIALESNTIVNAKFDIKVELLRENKNFEITITGDGTRETTCDRCTADIVLPITFTSKVYAQINDYPNPDDLETYYIEEKDTELNLATMVYNEICLHQPLINVYDCDSTLPIPCDLETLDRLETDPDPSSDNGDNDTPSPWDSLKDTNFN